MCVPNWFSVDTTKSTFSEANWLAHRCVSSGVL